MAVADLAAQGKGAPVSLSDIGVRQGISLTFLEQIFGKLRRADIVASHRGAKGGYALALPANHISLDAVIRAVDASAKAHGCNPETRLACTGGTDRCLTHDLWGALENHIEMFLAGITIQDVVEGRFPVAVAIPASEMEAAE